MTYFEPPHNDPDDFDEADFVNWVEQRKEDALHVSEGSELHLVFFDDPALKQQMNLMAAGMGWDKFLPALIRLPTKKDERALIAFGLVGGAHAIGAPLEVIC
jgi:hypothetical protein